ncbi:MAG: zonular occludens toxin domain-containing protein [Bacteroidales bacterium]|nr:zonular occludens toxin domain-containing protein [Bacteroidales bacterium]
MISDNIFANDNNTTFQQFIQNKKKDNSKTPKRVIIKKNKVKLNDNGTIDLGAANKSCINRLSHYAQTLANDVEHIPPSPFIEWAADRVAGKMGVKFTPKYDLILFIQGRRGSGKSYTALYLAKRLAVAVAKRRGGTWEDFFTIDNVAALEDTERVIELLSNKGKNQIIIVDDCSLAISNRSWNSPSNKNWNALLSVCRTNNWIVIMTAPLKSHVDNQTREMTDFTATIIKSSHALGFNILKILSSEISPSGVEYNHHFSVGKTKVRYWVSFRPDKDLVAQYDKEREQSAIRLNQRIVETGSYCGKGAGVKKTSTIERNLQENLNKHSEKVKQLLRDDPNITMTKLAEKCGIHYSAMSRMVENLGLTVKKRKLYKGG